MNSFFKNIIARRGKQVIGPAPDNKPFTVLKYPQKGMHRRDSKFLEASEEWLFNLDPDNGETGPAEGEIFTKEGDSFLIVGVQRDTNDDTNRAEVYELPYQLNYYALKGGTNKYGKAEMHPVTQILGNKEEVLRNMDRWAGSTLARETFLLPVPENEPAKGCQLALLDEQNNETRNVTIDKVQPLRSSSGKLIGWRLIG